MGSAEEFAHRVDRGLVRSLNGFEVRPDGEMQRIIARALELADGDAGRAQRLMRAAMFSDNCRTWGLSLECVDTMSDFLTAEAEVCKLMEELAERGAKLIEESLLAHTLDSYVFNLAEAPLYLGMVEDLLGKPGVAKLVGKLREVKLDKVAELLTEDVVEECSSYYRQVVGRLVFEWEDEALVTYFGGALGALEYYNGPVFDELREGSVMDQMMLDSALANTDYAMDDALTEVLRRGLVTPRKSLRVKMYGRKERKVTYEEAEDLLREARNRVLD